MVAARQFDRLDQRVAAQPLAVAARATRGRFFWATREDGRPLVQVAVEDPDPPDRTVRLGGRTILDRASASLPPKSRVGLIGRNGAGKSTLMKVMIGQLEADEGGIEMPRRTRVGYIAQEAPSGTATPFETVLAAAERKMATEGDKIGRAHV